MIDACDPDADLNTLRKLIKLNTGENIKLTKTEICQVYENIQDGKLPLPPLILDEKKTYLTDRKSPLSVTDYERLFDSSTKLGEIKKLARKVKLEDIEKKTKSDLIEAIGKRLRHLKVIEPVKLSSKRVITKKTNAPVLENENVSDLNSAMNFNENRNNLNENLRSNGKNNLNKNNFNRNNLNRNNFNRNNLNRNNFNRNRDKKGVRFPDESIFKSQPKPDFLKRSGSSSNSRQSRIGNVFKRNTPNFLKRKVPLGGDTNFIEANKFNGSKIPKGFVFKTGNKGLGYYRYYMNVPFPRGQGPLPLKPLPLKPVTPVGPNKKTNINNKKPNTKNNNKKPNNKVVNNVVNNLVNNVVNTNNQARRNEENRKKADEKEAKEESKRVANIERNLLNLTKVDRKYLIAFKGNESINDVNKNAFLNKVVKDTNIRNLRNKVNPPFMFTRRITFVNPVNYNATKKELENKLTEKMADEANSKLLNELSTNVISQTYVKAFANGQPLKTVNKQALTNKFTKDLELRNTLEQGNPSAFFKRKVVYIKPENYNAKLKNAKEIVEGKEKLKRMREESEKEETRQDTPPKNNVPRGSRGYMNSFNKIRQDKKNSNAVKVNNTVATNNNNGKAKTNKPNVFEKKRPMNKINENPNEEKKAVNENKNNNKNFNASAELNRQLNIKGKELNKAKKNNNNLSKKFEPVYNNNSNSNSNSNNKPIVGKKPGLKATLKISNNPLFEKNKKKPPMNKINENPNEEKKAVNENTKKKLRRDNVKRQIERVKGITKNDVDELMKMWNKSKNQSDMGVWKIINQASKRVQDKERENAVKGLVGGAINKVVKNRERENAVKGLVGGAINKVLKNKNNNKNFNASAELNKQLNIKGKELNKENKNRKREKPTLRLGGRAAENRPKPTDENKKRFVSAINTLKKLPQNKKTAFKGQLDAAFKRQNLNKMIEIKNKAVTENKEISDKEKREKRKREEAKFEAQKANEKTQAKLKNVVTKVRGKQVMNAVKVASQKVKISQANGQERVKLSRKNAPKTQANVQTAKRAANLLKTRETRNAAVGASKAVKGYIERRIK